MKSLFREAVREREIKGAFSGHKKPRTGVDFKTERFVMRGAGPSSDNRELDVKQEVHHIAIFNDVLFPF